MNDPSWFTKRPKHAPVKCGPIDGNNAVGYRKQINRTNEHGTCLYCGTKLRAYKYPEHFSNPDRRGDYGDNAFCGLRCGYQFGLTMAVLGKRLVPRKD